MEKHSAVLLCRSSRGQPQLRPFTVIANYEPAIFDNASNVTLIVPNTISTPSVTGQAVNLFQKPVTAPAGTNTNGKVQ